MKFIAILLFAIISLRAGAAPLVVGDTAPNWLLTQADGQQVLLYDQADSGKSTLMVFWSSWCKRCAELLPEIAKLKKSFGSSAPIAFYALNVWEDKPIDEYLQAHPLDLDVVVRADDVARRFNVGHTAAVIVVGEDKKLRYISPIDIAPDVLIRELTQLLTTSKSGQAERRGVKS